MGIGNNVDPPATPPWVFQQPAGIVQSQIDLMNGRADAALTLASTSISQLEATNLGTDSSSVPDFQMPDIPGTSIARPTDPKVLNLGTVDAFVTPTFTVPTAILDQLESLIAGLPAPGSWVNPIPTLNVPQPPAPIDTSGQPVHPDLIDVPVPDTPAIPIAQMGALLQINLPAPFTFDEPEIGDAEASFTGTPVVTVLGWHEPTYTPQVLNQVVATVQAMLTGSFSMPAGVLDMLFDQGREAEDDTAQAAIDEAGIKWAARGFSMPPGMLVDEVRRAGETNQFQSNARIRDGISKSAQWEIDNLRAAMSTGTAIEQMLMTQFNNVAQRGFDALKARLDADVSMYQQYVALYNADISKQQLLVAFVNAKIAIINVRLDAWKTQLEEEQLKGTLNETTAKIFATQVEAYKGVIQMFQATVDAAKIRSDINKNILDGYKSDVEAFGQLLTARKVVFDAYEAEMRGVEAEGRVVEASARAFAATMEAQSALANVKVSAIRGEIEAMGYATQLYTAETNGERDKITAQATVIDANARAFSADVSRYSAELQGNTEEVRLAITLAEARLRNNIAYYETRIREYDQAMSRLIERGRVVVSAITAAGNMAAQLASGAMAAMHVQASLSGSGNASTSWGNNYSYSENHNFEDESS